ncbi:3-hydroxyacyl-CoA dehydrogenase/enoyl-CoA hydratase family protein [Rickettsiales endosymbiont of Stachyamoeba lipophora]|uniref:3-hydroxyacyl-CoA dehydrogenase/enoyl-CoA hydratase family protein n=1 Tax=Rickettsiales endosymbiont of Stachyamoeba lipophora TaxID=2486578 RepID=UPI000F655294|nr:3-hydroxyacyl-CoA dehydrogenase/enoyl-CoA hydratase family protein [Rickettsiales endosymbiont of Stachyamoeba lipophora]AZL15593.1 3-hydroxyacyl-CoA dehydrogenase/enoyl-CoA hydratase family protein [Rickettsiales endosymbiont of Stachyamoeba lipophora]
MISIKKVAVIGSGVMGAQIAAHLANSDTSVILFDLAGAEGNRNELALKAIERLIKDPLKPLMSESLAKHIYPANLEDDLNLLQEADWIIEAIIEKPSLKKNLYQTIAPFLKTNCIISSNTSTIKLNDLTQGVSDNFKAHFLITHFFNPVRYLSLLELVTSPNTNNIVTQTIEDFCYHKLGKIIIKCKDAPGFIANRLGCFWLELGLRKAIKYNINPYHADLVLSKYFGIPKTGIFKLWDLIGVDLMPLISQSIIENLPQEDNYNLLMSKNEPVIEHMIAHKLLGNKAKQGFYKKQILENGTKQELVLNFKNYEYEELPEIESITKFKDMKELLDYPGNIGKFAWEVLSSTLNYAATLYPQSAFNINDIDIAMKAGYGWKYGPFELIDSLRDDNAYGTQNLSIKLQLDNLECADLLKEVDQNSFYQNNFYWHEGQYQQAKELNDNKLKTLKAKNIAPLHQNSTAKLWDLGKNILGLEFSKKMHVLDYNGFEMMEHAIHLAESKYDALFILSDDQHFSAGADLKILSELIEQQAFDIIAKLIDYGQKTHQKLKYAKIPVISLASNIALGGGCELLLHSHGIVIHADTKVGLVESNIGLIPGWGGCKEMILRAFFDPTSIDVSKNIINSFKLILEGYQSSSAIDAIQKGLLKKENTRIVMNANNLFDEGLALAEELKFHNQKITLPESIYLENVKNHEFSKLLSIYTAHEKAKIAEYLYIIFTGNNQTVIKEEGLLKLEQHYFIELCKQATTRDKINQLFNKT